MDNLIRKYSIWFVLLWGVLLFVPFLGAVHLFDWDEINFAESAREMLVTGNYQQVQINYKPFIEKPPLFFWLQVLSMKLFGINEFAARFPNAIIGIATLLIAFYLAKKHFGKRMAFIWVLCITGSFTPHLYFKSGIIDPLYNLFIFLSVYQLFFYTISNKKWLNATLLGLFLGLAIITKGPVAVIILTLCLIVLWVQQKFKLFFNWKDVLLAIAAAFVVSFAWFGIETIQHGPYFLIEFIKYQADLFLNPVAGHGQPFWYHPLVLLVGAFPSSIIAMPVLFKKQWQLPDQQKSMFTMMQVLFWVTLILFSIVETKIVHYSSLCYLPLTFMAAYFINGLFVAGFTFKIWQKILLLTIGFIIAFLFTAIALIDLYKENLIPYINDAFAVGNLSVSGEWRGYEVFPGLFFLAVLMVAFVQMLKQKVLQGILLLLLYISLLIPVFLRIVVPHVEAYSQRSAIDFYKSLQGEDCYVETVGFKSYAQYFYAKVMPVPNQSKITTEWLLTGILDKPAYLVLKEGNTESHINPTMVEMFRKGGFVFYKRLPGVAFINEQTEQR